MLVSTAFDWQHIRIIVLLKSSTSHQTGLNRSHLGSPKGSEVARGVASEVHRAGVLNTASGLAKLVYTKYEPTAKQLYAKYEPKAEQCAVLAWRKLNKLPLFPQVASVVVPTAAYCSDKYNETVVSSAEKGYKVASYLPSVPAEKIAKVFGEQTTEMEPLVSESLSALNLCLCGL
ncbi:hypothetical protein ES288_D11G145300v1 [Gossypium darwinii]|uniref:REF/SRPP-like protein At3g05500 n=1 Tax=Gossypium darwinii TaxID=34276 RepID=A0A5D2AJV7_GOSDA|nr:hypothetical protein ES288_D11G145300v1 [Gossypium darwinii]